MALVIRLRKLGAKHKPFFRIAVTETTAARDGRFLEEIGRAIPRIHVLIEHPPHMPALSSQDPFYSEPLGL